MSVQADITGFTRGQAATITDTVYAADGSRQNITGWSLAFYLRKNFLSSSAVLVTKTTGSGITITDGANGVMQIALDRADTASLGAGSYVWDVWRVDSGSEAPLTKGRFVIEDSAKL